MLRSQSAAQRSDRADDEDDLEREADEGHGRDHGARAWSQSQLGDALGVSRQTVNAIENGRYDPSLPLAFKLADVFEVSIETLFTQ